MKQLTIFTLVLTLVVIVLGAYVRLSDAGLGCPDWPGCYGQLLVPEETSLIEQANQAFPERPLEKAKAWKEMVHRYVAGFLGLCILAIAMLAWKTRGIENRSPALPFTLLGLVIFQALLGMWTVTLLLKPVIVVAHLLGGMTILLLLCWHYLSVRHLAPIFTQKHGLFPWTVLALIILYTQISLGGWTSANYAALVCSDLPTCQGQWWPKMNFEEGFRLWRGLGQDYEGGVLDATARTAIHVVHRIGAVFTVLVLLGVAGSALMTGIRVLQAPALAVIILVLAQATLGVLNIVLVLPLPIAVAHNGVAALLLISVGTLLYHAKSIRPTE